MDSSASYLPSHRPLFHSPPFIFVLKSTPCHQLLTYTFTLSYFLSGSVYHGLHSSLGLRLTWSVPQKHFYVKVTNSSGCFSIYDDSKEGTRWFKERKSPSTVFVISFSNVFWWGRKDVASCYLLLICHKVRSRLIYTNHGDKLQKNNHCWVKMKTDFDGMAHVSSKISSETHFSKLFMIKRKVSKEKSCWFGLTIDYTLSQTLDIMI